MTRPEMIKHFAHFRSYSLMLRMARTVKLFANPVSSVTVLQCCATRSRNVKASMRPSQGLVCNTRPVYDAIADTWPRTWNARENALKRSPPNSKDNATGMESMPYSSYMYCGSTSFGTPSSVETCVELLAFAAANCTTSAGSTA